MDAGLPTDRIAVVLDEVEAIGAGIEWAESGDLVVALVYRIERAWETVTRRAEVGKVPAG